MKKPWYKIWWVWMLAVAVIAIIGALANGNERDKEAGAATSPSTVTDITLPSAPESLSQEPTEEPTWEPTETPVPEPEADPTPSFAIYSAGMYKVGPDIPEGEYLMSSSGYGYYQVSSDSTGDFESIIANENFDTFTILTVSEGNYLTLSRSEMCLLSDFFAGYSADITTRSLGYHGDGTYGPGMYKVGLMLPAGEYELTSMGGHAYVAVMRDSLCIGVDSIVSNDNFDTNKYITVKDGQYLQVNNATITPVE